MSHIIATSYSKVVVELEKQKPGISETFFQIRGQPPLNPNTNIICLGLIPNHFVHAFLKDGCSIPPIVYEVEAIQERRSRDIRRYFFGY
jgi:hypothetical protein